MNTFNESNMRAWIAALRSGKYPQDQFSLHKPTGYCCLGVACDISGLGEWRLLSNSELFVFETEHDSDVSRLPDIVAEWLGIDSVFGIQIVGSDKRLMTLITLNDDLKLSFSQIADIIEAYVNGWNLVITDDVGSLIEE